MNNLLLGFLLASLFYIPVILIQTKNAIKSVWDEEFSQWKECPRLYIKRLQMEFSQRQIKEEEEKLPTSYPKPYNPAADY